MTFPEIGRALSSVVPHPSSPAGKSLTKRFRADILGLMGDDPRFLWIPDNSISPETTTSADRTRQAKTFTYNTDVPLPAARFSVLGSGWAMDFEGTVDEADSPDDDLFTFGDGAVDEPASWFALVSPDVVNTTMVILGKRDQDATGQEWMFYMDGNGYPTLQLFDDSSTGSIGREDQTALTAATWVLLRGTYDGTASNVGVSVYKDGALVDDANASGGTYTAMENKAGVVTLGHNIGAGPAAANFWNGKMAMVGLTGKQFDHDEVYEMVKLVNSYYDLSL